MAVKIRLARRGRKKRAMYDVVIADARAPRDGRFIEKIGTYNPNTDPASINIDNDKAFDWVMKGAQPTDTVRAMLSYRGVMFRKHLQVGVDKGAISQEDADKKLAAWVEDKESKISGKTDQLAKAKAEARKAKLEAEAKVSAARAEAIAAKNVVVEEVAEEEVEETAEATEAVEAEAPVVEEAATEETPVVEEAPAEEVVAEEAPAVEEAPAEEVAAEAAPEVEETPAEEAPAAEEAEEAPKAEAEEAPAADASEDAAEEEKA
ncbi:30S ribosomal protein S16 [Roseivirga sp. E12]|uniref:30S ribosomal protein S16 n=1 Tax=Roseivirga sp. E12 TaxID=2819237 RepID=UPI001ABC119F|nr:30S ribosomal protein S16 [Roseivirga sp. E12]MBO3699459.1 30S ribosomal protein S16 [Roseivirga sp. E12]